jgi:glycosyltransferase involved in cell wall biosynthesis
VTAGFHSPLPPARTGVADYAAALLSALQRHGTVKVNSGRADVFLYHLGNNRLHRSIYDRALQRPGVAVLHDASVHHLLLDYLGRDAYVEEFAYNYGEWNRSLALELWHDSARCTVDPRYFRYAMLRRIAERSRAVIVHNPAAARIVRSHAPGARVVEIPHLFHPPALPSVSMAIRYREGLGLQERTFVFGVFGYLRESKRLPSILRAFQKVRDAHLDISLLAAGEFVSSDLERAVGPALQQPGIYHAGHTREREFRQLVSAADACINLRYPSAGETSGIAIRSMGIGKPVLVTDNEENSCFPEAACLRVEAGVAEVDSLVEYMVWLAQFPGAAREIGSRAARHIREHHSLDDVADAYWKVLSNCCS